MGDYFAHWLQMGRKVKNPPAIFCVNWFRLDKDGKFLWPGFGENMRVLKWVFDRVHGRGAAIQNVLGWMPRYEDLDWTGLDSVTREQYDELMSIDLTEWQLELERHGELFDSLKSRLPKDMVLMLQMLALNFARI